MRGCHNTACPSSLYVKYSNGTCSLLQIERFDCSYCQLIDYLLYSDTFLCTLRDIKVLYVIFILVNRSLFLCIIILQSHLKHNMWNTVSFKSHGSFHVPEMGQKLKMVSFLMSMRSIYKTSSMFSVCKQPVSHLTVMSDI